MARRADARSWRPDLFWVVGSRLLCALKAAARLVVTDIYVGLRFLINAGNLKGQRGVNRSGPRWRVCSIARLNPIQEGASPEVQKVLLFQLFRDSTLSTLYADSMVG